MPLKRRSTFKPKRAKRNYKPRRYVGKRIPRSIPATTHVFKRLGNVVKITNQGDLQPIIQTFSQPNVSTGWSMGTVTSDTAFGTSQFAITGVFKLDQALSYSEFQTLYDRYKIVGVKLKFMYQHTTGQDQVDFGVSGSNYSRPLPIMDHTIDLDDGQVPLQRTTVQQHSYCKTNLLHANGQVKRYIKPRMRTINYAGVDPDGVTPAYGYQSAKPSWLDASNPHIEHYGFKAWISSWPYDSQSPPKQTANGILTIQPVFYLAMKDSQ